ncbi:amidohydrolase family protein [Phaeobacter gallaeciensis]|uniref:Cytosine deaminase CodA n=1 Tax=Phaeobacter gallaeciensis TaxID=60890 RepID=A0AAC9Z6D0_9RHOB|nr:amidohydrolase family protein [Phaeobacter gallaeciensis]AHD08517.1 Cytosine deaminase [Phaeobacter gallaeciensis DSM 26640]ATE91783.1 cytosine deaminase CodA [Phaeobacter gallaeciensis]ATE98393.1 cytosine deaminase CodA [Phaeobacter gallaeciensis]ATF00399.1 cytosine deaminase CodA [Phaeobacter gallaeciensis]ATF04831.1 cytosine deaminase CodA [Phaeobacter gallaeciensis]
MLDLLIKGGTLPDGSVADIGITGDRISEVAASITAETHEVIDASGDLVSPPFVDPHFHMDATLSYGLPRVNASGTLLEGISLWGELREQASVDDMVNRALTYCDWAASMGLLAIRTHVDITADHLRGVTAMLEVREAVKEYIDLQLVAFPQDGLYRAENGRENLIRALDMGVDVVGGIPHFERSMQDGSDSLRDLCKIAADRGLQVDIHCDETDDPLSRHIETLAQETLRHGLQGRVAGSHLTSMHSMDNYYVSKLLPLIAEAEIAAIPNPLINIVLQGRHDSFPKRRGLTRVKELLEAGVTVGWGQDCVLDPWYSLGTGDMLDVAFMGMHVAQMTHPDEMAQCFTMVTESNAAIMGLEGYGLKKGDRASLVVLDAATPTEALRLRPARLAVISRGKVISRSARGDADLSIPGRPAKVRRRHQRPG